MSRKLSRVAIACLLSCLFLGACSSIAKIPAKGEFFGEDIETTVDSDMARYYLESYLQGKNENRDMDERMFLSLKLQGRF